MDASGDNKKVAHPELTRTIRIDLDPTATLKAKTAQVAPAPRPAPGRWRMRSAERSTPFFKLLESIYDAVFITSVDGKIIECNERAADFFRQSIENLRGQSIVKLISGASDQLIERIQENLEDRKYTLIEARCNRADSTSFAAEIAVNRIELDLKGQLCFLVRDITIRHQAQAELKYAVERLQAHDRARMEFISNVSHELRTPLTSMIYGVNNMLRGVVGPMPEKAVFYLERLQADCNRLLATVNDILDMRQIENKTLVLTKAVAPLSSIVKDGADALQIQADAKRIALKYDFPQTDLFCLCDSQKIERVILNIVGNAVKFTPGGGTITVSLKPSPGTPARALIAVCDTGLGIPPEYLPRLTQRYFRVGEQVSGTGLGLSISREIVEIHGGTMHFASPVPGTTCGTAVYVELPLTTPPTVIAWSQLADVVGYVSKRIPALGYGFKLAADAADAIRLCKEFPGQHFLLVDARITDLDIRDMIVRIRDISTVQRMPIIVIGVTRQARTDIEFYRNFGIYYHCLPWDDGEFKDALALAVRGKLR